MKKLSLVSVLFLGLTFSTQAVPVPATPSGYHILDSLPLSGEGGWDLYALDTAQERLYISRGSRVQVFDCTNKKIVGEIPNTNGVHGIALAAALGKGFTSNGKDSSVTVFDLKTLKQLAVIKLPAKNPDVILFDSKNTRIFVFNGGSNNAVAIDARTRAIIGTVTFNGKPELAVVDERGHVFVNIEDKSEIVAFDGRTGKIHHTWQLFPGKEPTGLALDRKNHRLFSTCGNNLMIILDCELGKTIAQLPIGGGVDGAGFDPQTQYAFSSNGDGTLTVVHEETPMKFTVIDNVTTRKGARTMVIDEKTHHIYMLSAKFGPAPAPTADHPHPRPVLEAGSVTLYILGR